MWHIHYTKHCLRCTFHLESVLEGYGEYYSADLAEKVVRGQTENILKGRCNGGRTGCYPAHHPAGTV